MPKPSTSAIQNRYDIAYFFDITDGNPNGDPDAGNMPRIDPETNHALVTDVCLKRKIRNYVGMKHAEKPPYEIYVKEKAVLNSQHERAYEALKLKSSDKKAANEKSRELTGWMCQNFFDIRAFGAVMSTGVNCGQVRGPVQATMARSLHPILQLEHSVTRCAVTTPEESAKQDGGNRTMGRKFTIPYALFRNHFFISPMLADPDRNGTGFSEADLALVKEALNMMFDHDRSAARGTMAPVEILAFRHDSAMGNARADQLFSLITCEAAPEVRSGERPPRSKADFNIRVDEKRLPEGVTLERWLIH